MATAREAEVVKLLTSAINACAKAEGGDSAEQERALEALKVLKRQQVTADLLAKTDAGKKVKKLCKHASDAIKAAAADVVDVWKECVRAEQKKKQEGSSTAPKAVDSRADQPSESGRQGSLNMESQDSLSTGMSSGPAVKLARRPARCGDATRDKIRDLLAEALALASADDVPGDPAEIAVEVEDAMFRQNGGVNQKYKAKYRTLGFNLKDPNNPDLRSKVLMGDIPPDILVNLTAEELGSDDRRQGNEKIRKHMQAECERGQQNMASTDMFQCGKCKQRKTTYYQLQTRSADEPMTTFVTCVNCGNRWKFC